MARQSISFTQPNDEWLKNQVDRKEYSTKSELVNDLIRLTINLKGSTLLCLLYSFNEISMECL